MKRKSGEEIEKENKSQKIDNEFEKLEILIKNKINLKSQSANIKNQMKVEASFDPTFKFFDIKNAELHLNEKEDEIKNINESITAILKDFKQEDFTKYFSFTFQNTFRDIDIIKPMILWNLNNLPSNWFENISFVLSLSFVSLIIQSDLINVYNPVNEYPKGKKEYSSYDHVRENFFLTGLPKIEFFEPKDNKKSTLCVYTQDQIIYLNKNVNDSI